MHKPVAVRVICPLFNADAKTSDGKEGASKTYNGQATMVTSNGDMELATLNNNTERGHTPSPTKTQGSEVCPTRLTNLIESINHILGQPYKVKVWLSKVRMSHN